jgi:hypothetical protein
MTHIPEIWYSIILYRGKDNPFIYFWFHRFNHQHTYSWVLSLSNGATARVGPRPPSRVSSIPPGLGRPLSSFYIPALPHPPPSKLRSFSKDFYSVSCLVVVLPSVFVTRDFSKVGESVQRSTPNLEDQGNLLVWPLSFDLYAKGDPTSSYATNGKALRVIGVLKLLYCDKVEVPTEEMVQSIKVNKTLKYGTSLVV